MRFTNRSSMAASFSTRSSERQRIIVSVEAMFSLSGQFTVLTWIPSRTSRHPSALICPRTCRSNALGVPTMYRPPRPRMKDRLASDTLPRSITQMRPVLPCSDSTFSTISWTVVLSAVFPSKTSYPTG